MADDTGRKRKYRRKSPNTRLLVTLTPDDVAIIDRFAEITGGTRAGVVRSVFREALPGLRHVLKLYDKACDKGPGAVAARAMIVAAGAVLGDDGKPDRDDDQLDLPLGAVAS